jgi:hypothetical protein
MSLLGERVHCDRCDIGYVTEGVYLVITFICLESNVIVMCHQSWVQGLLLSKAHFKIHLYVHAICFLVKC